MKIKTHLAVFFAGIFTLFALLLPHSNMAARADVPPALAKLFGGSFSLIDHLGKSRTDKDFNGSYMLIYFGYTYCPDVCPVDLQHVSDAVDILGKKGDQIQPIFITVDPARDTSRALKAYVSHFHPRLIGLTGSEAEIKKVAKSFRVHRRKFTPKGGTPDEYLVDHSSLTLLMGTEGQFLTLFPHNTNGEEMAKRIKTYLP